MFATTTKGGYPLKSNLSFDELKRQIIALAVKDQCPCIFVDAPRKSMTFYINLIVEEQNNHKKVIGGEIKDYRVRHW